MSGIKNKAVSEMMLKRKLIRKNQKDDEDDISIIQKNLKHKDKIEDLEDSKISIKKSKINSMSNDDVSKNDFLSIYLAERDKKKKKRKKRNSKNKQT